MNNVCPPKREPWAKITPPLATLKKAWDEGSPNQSGFADG
jgi:hypothetical protein